jgi:carbon-monoxide dehydrogenase medium subunit
MPQEAVDVTGPQSTEYFFASSVAEVMGLLDSHAGEARIIAGGTDLLPDIRKGNLQGRLRPRCLVDITRIPDLDLIRLTQDFVEVGAAVTFAALRESAFINQQVHALADAAGCVGAEAIQNAATWVGNLVQAMPAADGAIVALALDAEARVLDAGRWIRSGTAHPNGSTRPEGEASGHPERTAWVPVESLFRGPGVSCVDATRQFITHLRFPRPGDHWGTAWGRIGRRPSLVLPILNCAVRLCLDVEGKQIETVRIALGPVAPCPYRARQAEAYLEGRPPDSASFAETARLAQQEANPRDSITRASRAYRLDIILPMIESALETAAQRALAARRSQEKYRY